jgi:hypothetical protein
MWMVNIRVQNNIQTCSDYSVQRVTVYLVACAMKMVHVQTGYSTNNRMKEFHWHICLDHLNKSTKGWRNSQPRTPHAAMRHWHAIHGTRTHWPYCQGDDRDVSPTQTSPTVMMPCTKADHGDLSTIPRDPQYGVSYHVSRAVCTTFSQRHIPSSHLTWNFWCWTPATISAFTSRLWDLKTFPLPTPTGFFCVPVLTMSKPRLPCPAGHLPCPSHNPDMYLCHISADLLDYMPLLPSGQYYQSLLREPQI